MASLSTDSKGNRRVLFLDCDGKRRTLRIGKLPKRQAEVVKAMVEHLAAAKCFGAGPDGEASRWLSMIDASLYNRLAKVGLARPRFRTRLREFLTDYSTTRQDVKGATSTSYGHTGRNLVEHFGADKPLRDITPGDADKWRLYLIGQGLAENTVRRRSSMAKQFFRAALRQGLIDGNPFADLQGNVLAIREKDHFITREEAAKVLDACPDAQWRLLFALSRYGGLRCPSEHQGLRWEDIDWERGRITIHSPKTERYAGKESRTLPLFPELRPYLVEVWDAAKEGAEFVITRYRCANASLRTDLLRIIKLAGLKAWPKLFQNLRATRQTELAERYPAHVVCAWMGNSQAVAAKHYLQVTDEHYADALREAAQSTSVKISPTEDEQHETVTLRDSETRCARAMASA